MYINIYHCIVTLSTCFTFSRVSVKLNLFCNFKQLIPSC